MVLTKNLHIVNNIFTLANIGFSLSLAVKHFSVGDEAEDNSVYEHGLVGNEELTKEDLIDPEYEDDDHNMKNGGNEGIPLKRERRKKTEVPKKASYTVVRSAFFRLICKNFIWCCFSGARWPRFFLATVSLPRSLPNKENCRKCSEISLDLQSHSFLY